MRLHKDGYIQCRQVTVWIPEVSYRVAIATGMYRNEGLEKEIEHYLDVDISGALTFRVLKIEDGMALIQIDSNWVQPTRS